MRIKEIFESGRGEWVHPAMRRPRRGPEPPIKHNFKVGDKVLAPTVRGNRRDMKKGTVKRIEPNRVAVVGHNIYYPDNVQWFKPEELKKEGE